MLYKTVSNKCNVSSVRLFVDLKKAQTEQKKLNNVIEKLLLYNEYWYIKEREITIE